MSEVKLNLIDSQETLHGTIHGSVVDACVVALSAEPETIAELVSALARYIKPLDEVSPFASFRSTKISVPSDGVSQVEMSRGQGAGSNAQATIAQVEMSRGQEGGLAPALLRNGSVKALGSREPRGPHRGSPAGVLDSPTMSEPREHVSTAGASERVVNFPRLDLEPWDAGIVVIDLAARIVAVESTYSLPQAEGEVHYHDGTSSTDIPVMYRLPDDWLFVNSVEAYQWSCERRTAERLTKTPLDVREVLYGAPLLNFIVSECGSINLSEVAAPAEQLAKPAVAEDAREEEAAADDARANAVAEDASADAADDASKYSVADHARKNAVLEYAAAERAVAEDAAAEDGAAEDALAAEISNIHARWLTTPREDLRGQSPREVLLARQDFIDFDLHTRSLQWTFLDEGPPCLPHDSFAYRFAGFGTHEFVIYYDLVRHLICTLVESLLNKSPTSNVQSPTFDTRTPTFNVQGSIQLGISHGQEGGLPPQRGCPAGDPGAAPALLSTSSTAAQAAATQLGISHGQEGGHAPAPIRTGSGSDRMPDSTQEDLGSNYASTEHDKHRTGSGSDRMPDLTQEDLGSNYASTEHDKHRTGSGSDRMPDSTQQLLTTLDHIKTNWLETPQPEYGGRLPAILIDNERKRLPEAMRPRDMIVDEDCPMCQMLGDETTPLGMGVGFWHLDGCNMDDDFAFSSYKTREEWEAENRRRDEFNAEFNRKWEERQQRIARGEPIEFDPFLDPDPFPGFELDEPSLISNESTDDEEELAQ